MRSNADELQRRRRQLLLAACAAVGGGYFAYKTYNSRTWGEAHEQLRRALRALQRCNTAASAASDSVALLASDLRDFLSSNADELPQSWRQLAKLAQCQEVRDAVTSCVAASVQGAAQAVQLGAPGQLPLVDKVIEAFLCDRGRSLVGLAVATAARSSTEAFCDSVRLAVTAAVATASSSASGGDGSPAWSSAQHALDSLLSLLSSERSQQLVASLVGSSMRGALGACMEAAAEVDMMGPVLAAISRPQHHAALTAICSAAAAASTREMMATAFPPAVACDFPQSAQQRQQRRQHGVAEALVGVVVVDGGDSSVAAGEDSGDQAPGSCGSSEAASKGCDGAEPRGTPAPSSPQSGPGTPEPSLASGGLFAALLARQRGRQGSAASRASDAPAGAAPTPAAGSWGRVAASPTGGSGLAALGPLGSMLLLTLEACRYQELRALMLDACRSSTQEALRTLLPAGILLGGPGGGEAARSGASGGSTALAHPGQLQHAPHAELAQQQQLVSSQLFRSYLYRLYSALSVLLFLGVYALSPRTIAYTSDGA